jgi:hypothetical protein
VNSSILQLFAIISLIRSDTTKLPIEGHKKSDLGNEGIFNMDGWNESPGFSSK